MKLFFEDFAAKFAPSGDCIIQETFCYLRFHPFYRANHQDDNSASQFKRKKASAFRLSAYFRRALVLKNTNEQTRTLN